MTIKRILLQPLSEDHDQEWDTIDLSASLVRKFRLSSGSRPDLVCGHRRIAVNVEASKEKGIPVMKWHKKLFEHFSLPIEDYPLHIFYNKSKNELSVGPFFCILTTRHKDDSQPLGRLDTFCREMAEYGKRRHVACYVAFLEDWEDKKTLCGFWPGEQQERKKVPIPDLVYNRIHSRKKERSTEMKAFKKYCSNHSIEIFNDHFLNKWEVHEILNNQDELAPFLPATALLDDSDTIENLLEEHQHVFLKPIHGSQGKSIIRIRSEERYCLEYSTFSGEKRLEQKNLAVLIKAIKHRIGKIPYIVQQGIDLLLDKDRPIDFRILCMKVRDNWEIASAVARISKKGFFVSNLAQGGELKKMDEALIFFEKKQAEQIKKCLLELAVQIAEIIDREVDGHYAELGIDLTVDHNGHPWLIEINTKPSKTEQTSDTSSIRPSVKALVNYSLYLFCN
ncbi:YheC/YheD family protein [Pseudalkalibacillus caeni]|uniref:YheC/YheD family protein n=1 Tax=Exobacillus caeni TaxID=2574798 RepID=A0A5R9F4R8_9BACL|nr:YheC/YheD family protein [Pseudalkalibacillus caeni]TLS38031.1 YheC/YheD family protein [Pseudalkalibacillus caeni]